MKRALVLVFAFTYLMSAPNAFALGEDASLIVAQIEQSGELERFCAGDQVVRKRILQDASEKVKGRLPTPRAKQQFGGTMYKSRPEASEYIRSNKC